MKNIIVTALFSIIGILLGILLTISLTASKNAITKAYCNETKIAVVETRVDSLVDILTVIQTDVKKILGGKI